MVFEVWFTASHGLCGDSGKKSRNTSALSEEKKKLLHKDREDDGVGGKLIEGREIKESNKVDAGCGSDGKREINPKMLDKSETQTKY